MRYLLKTAGSVEEFDDRELALYMLGWQIASGEDAALFDATTGEQLGVLMDA